MTLNGVFHESGGSPYEVAHFYSIQCILDNNSPSAVVNQLKPDMITTGTGDDEDMQAKIDTYKRMSRALDQEISALKKQVSVMEELESELKVMSKQKSEKCEQQEAELNVLRKEKSDYEAKCERQEAELEAVRKEKLDYEEKFKQQEEELMAVKKEKLVYKDISHMGKLVQLSKQGK